MAITNVRTVQRVETYPAQDSSAESSTNEAHASLMVVYQHLFDDTTDNDLPVLSTVTKHLSRFVVTYDEDGEATSAEFDTAGEDQLVQNICAAIWN